MSQTTKQHLLERAAKLLGHDELAGLLHTAPSLLQAWINGQATMPERKLIALIDILDDISGFKK
jgi:hypothetical protein